VPVIIGVYPIAAIAIIGARHSCEIWRDSMSALALV
jgi:hypothetical protein